VFTSEKEKFIDNIDHTFIRNLENKMIENSVLTQYIFVQLQLEK
jgi:hypothetical protein